VIRSIKVVFPAPFLPSKANISPERMVSDILFSAMTLFGYYFDKFFMFKSFGLS
jgi:hypothetical protein